MKEIQEQIEKTLIQNGLNNPILINKILNIFRKSKEYIFVKHIEEHLKHMNKKTDASYKVCCKICGKDIDTIYKEEKNK